MRKFILAALIVLSMTMGFDALALAPVTASPWTTTTNPYMARTGLVVYSTSEVNALITSATNGSVTSAITNGLATTNYVNSITNGLATTNYVNSITNGLATTNYAKSVTNNFTALVYTNPSSILYTSSLPALTNGFVTSSVTNGLATTNYVNSTTQGLTNGLATTNYVNSITNGLATTNYVNSATQGLTNGLATTNYVNSITNGLATTNYVNAATNGFVTSSVTNGLATTNYVNAATNGLVTSSITNGLATTNYVNAATNGLATSSITNGLATTNYANSVTNNFTSLVYTNPSSILYTSSLPGLTNGFVTASVTNGLATTNYVNTATNGHVTASITNGLATTNYVNTATNGHVTASVTNGLATTSYVLTQISNTNLTNLIITTNLVVAATNNFTAIVYSNPAAYRLIGNTNFPGIYITNNAYIGGYVSNNSGQLTFAMKGDTYGGSKLILQNRSGQNGPLFDGSDCTAGALIDFGLRTTLGVNYDHVFRLEQRGGAGQLYRNDPNNSGYGEIQFFHKQDNLIFASLGEYSSSIGLNPSPTTTNTFNVSGTTSLSGNTGIGTETPRGKLDVIDGTLYSISDSPGFDSSYFAYDSSGAYAANDSYYEYDIYLYKNTPLGRVYSVNPIVFSGYDNGGAGDAFYMYWNLLTPDGADGYRVIVVSDPSYGANGDYYFDTTSTSALISTTAIGYDDDSNQYYTAGTPAVTPKTIDTRSQFYFDSSSSNIIAMPYRYFGIGTTNPTAMLTVKGSVSISGSVNEGSSIASGGNSHADGTSTASGNVSHSENNSTASGSYSHSEGNNTTASGGSSHAEGNGATASGNNSHAEGSGTATGLYAHAEGSGTIATNYSHAAGQNAKATNINTFVWSDGVTFGSTTTRQFSVFATNGIRLLGGQISGNGAGLTNITGVSTNFTTTSNPTNAYGAGTLYTNLTGQKALLVGSVVQIGSGSAILTYTNNGVGYRLPISIGASAAVNISFTVPISPNGTFNFTVSNFYLTNTVLWSY
jgi:hypothetical protein